MSNFCLLIISELLGVALSDAKKAIELEPRYIKGFYRKATCNLALGKYKLALKDYEYVSLKFKHDWDKPFIYILLFVGSQNPTKW